jgi:hypothetical protein
MSNAYLRLGAINPAANAQSNVFVVPSTSAVISTITVCNQSVSNVSYSLMLMSASEFANPAPTQTYLVRGATVPPADTIILTLGLTANTGSILAANTNSPNVSIMAFGTSIT